MSSRVYRAHTCSSPSQIKCAGADRQCFGGRESMQRDITMLIVFLCAVLAAADCQERSQGYDSRASSSPVSTCRYDRAHGVIGVVKESNAAEFSDPLKHEIFLPIGTIVTI